MAKSIMLSIIYISVVLIVFAITLAANAEEEELPEWDTRWNYRQEVLIPISTNKTKAQHQPIDIEIVFENNCWAISENQSSIRVVCLFNKEWYEIESQIYHLSFSGNNTLLKCNIIFLVPPFADGSERYFVFYSHNSTPLPTYINHVDVKDMYYSYSPFPEITAEAGYYGIIQDSMIIYGVGQKGQLLDRSFSQIIIKQQPQMQEFEVLNSDQIVSLAFSYYYGDNEDDESSSDQKFVDKKIWIDGNLMVEFGIISESRRGDIRTTVMYRYYYTPGDERRISAHVRHEFLDNAIVRGKINIDGRFGTIISIKSRNPLVERMNAGSIFPYIHFVAEDNSIEEYRMNEDPEARQRQWIIDYSDDADIGPQGWIAYGEGIRGKTRGVIFHGNTNIVRGGTDERDGIQLKAAVREYFDFLGTEVDYASINFGRNSYEIGEKHDLFIPKNLIVEFDTEIFAVDDAGYPAVKQEAQFFQKLVKYRKVFEDTEFADETKKYDLRVVTHFGGTRLSYPLLVRRLKLNLPTMEIEVYRDNQRIRRITANRSVSLRTYGFFPDLPEGIYLIKIYWRLSENLRLFNGVKVVRLVSNQEIHVFCTWQRRIVFSFINQDGYPLSNVDIQILGLENLIYAEGKTNADGKLTLFVPFSRQHMFIAHAKYKGISFYREGIPKRRIPIFIEGAILLYDLQVIIVDKSNMAPGVSLSPVLIPEGLSGSQLFGTDLGKGLFMYNDIPQGSYIIQVKYGQFTDSRSVVLNEDSIVSFTFSATFHLNIGLLDARGNSVENDMFDILIQRGMFHSRTSAESIFTLPPADYMVDIFQGSEQVGSKVFELNTDKDLEIVTTVEPLLPSLLSSSMVILMIIGFISFYFKRIPFLIVLKIFFIAFLLIGLMQPWWMLNGQQFTHSIEKTSTVYVFPPTMIEHLIIDNHNELVVAELPDIFTEAIGTITSLSVIGILLILGVFMTEWLHKTRYSILFLVIGMILIIASMGLFYLAMERLTEVSIGPVIGSGLSSVTYNSREYSISANWGFANGFYLYFIVFLCGVAILIKKVRQWWTRKR